MPLGRVARTCPAKVDCSQYWQMKASWQVRWSRSHQLHGSHVDCPGFAEAPRLQKCKWPVQPLTVMNLSSKLFLNGSILPSLMFKTWIPVFNRFDLSLSRIPRTSMIVLPELPVPGCSLKKRDCQLKSCRFVNERMPLERYVNGLIPTNSLRTLFPKLTSLKRCC